VAARRLGPAALGHVRHTEILSAGGLESYSECHMKWLIEKELQPVELEPQPEPLARGSYVHDVLEKLLSRLGSAVTPESLPDAIRILEELLAEISPQVAPGRSAAVRRAVSATIAADLRRYLELEASTSPGWPPRALELKFGFGEEAGGVPALVLGSGDQQVALRGAIDRIDVEPGGRRTIVRDYKSGSSRTEHQGNKWRSEEQLQVALYMVAVRELLGLEPVAGLYQPLLGRELRPRGVYDREAPVGGGLFANDARGPDELRADLDHACERAVALAAELRSGNLEPSPDTCSRDGCRYPGICRAV
jgi:ATP-dependent helicase/DNAse subunit B